MRIVTFVYIIALTTCVIAKELNTRLPFEETHWQTGHTEKKTVRGENSRTCGDNLSWTFNNETFSLTISGQGNMSCCSYSSTP